MSKPLVSVIMPVYNAEKFLKDTINSILTQTLADFEFIIINDASTDRSKEIIHSFSDARIRYKENEKNDGYIRSLNAALPLATGNFIARMDADDLSFPERFMRQHDYLQHESTIDLVGAAIKIEREGVPHQQAEEIWDYPTTPGGVKARLLFNTAHAHPVVFFRRSLIDRKLYQYEPDFYPAEDYRLWVKLNNYVRTSNLAEPQLIYRVSAHQTSSVAIEKQKNNAARVQAEYFSTLLKENNLDEKTIAQFWLTGFKVEPKTALQLLKAFESIYTGFVDTDFRKELACQMNRLVSMIYRVHPAFVNAYRNSVFEKAVPLSFQNRLKFLLYPLLKKGNK
jgi:glycosyltransferase involved in cell wall biosynthesis